MDSGRPCLLVVILSHEATLIEGHAAHDGPPDPCGLLGGALGQVLGHGAQGGIEARRRCKGMDLGSEGIY